MNGRFLFLLALLACACSQDEAPPDSHTGFITLDRTSAPVGKLGKLPASAAWCADDTTLSVVGTSGAWSAALALRAPWPLDSAAVIPVDSVRYAGHAQIAVRQLRDSVGTALVAHDGTIRLEAGRTLAGTFQFTAGHDSTAASMTGRLDGIDVVAICR